MTHGPPRQPDQVDCRYKSTLGYSWQVPVACGGAAEDEFRGKPVSGKIAVAPEQMRRVDMSDYIIQINIFEIKAGKLEEFKSSVRKSQMFAEKNDPVLMAEMYIDESNMRAHACLVHRDSDSILAHWEISEKQMTDVMAFCIPKRVEILGQPNNTVMERLMKYRELGVAVQMVPHFAGFTRF